ncbi:MAG: DUF5937 family protein [Bacillota bacterium]
MEVGPLAILFRLAGLAPERVSFGFSPAQEALHSLHVFLEPKAHPLHVPWVVRIRAAISPALKAEAEAFRFLFRKALPIFWEVWSSPDIRSFAEELADFRRRPLGPYIEGVASIAGDLDLCPDLSDPGGQQLVLEAAAAASPGSTPVLYELFADPERSRSRFADLLEAYWEQALAAEWPRLQELFLVDIEQRAGRLLRGGVMSALTDLSPYARLDHAAQTCILSSGRKVEAVLTEEDRLYLMPSYFAWPQLMIKSSPPYLITYPVFEHQREGRAPVPPEQLLKMLRAAGDMTRMQILQLIAQQPRSTTELAGLLSLSDAAVNKHLKQLQDAGLVVAERRSYYVFYHLARRALRQMALHLESTLTGGA